MHKKLVESTPALAARARSELCLCEELLTLRASQEASQ
jgi:hypothetical protein